jgi:chromate transporter
MIQTEEKIIHQTSSQIFLRFLRFGLLAWGGPVAQIAMIRQELVEEEKWVSKEKFNRALSVYQILPGPEAHELCVYFGMLAGGRWGGFLAGLGFMLPGFILMLLLTWIYVQFGIHSPAVLAVFSGFQVAVIALIFRAVHRIGEHALFDVKLLIIGVTSFVAYVLGNTFFIVLPVAGFAYVLWMRGYKMVTAIMGVALIASSILFFTPKIFTKEEVSTTTATDSTKSHTSLPAVFGTGLKGGLLTFGGAYTAIPFIREDAVVRHGWMSNAQFLDGIALGGILPAPLIIFSTFVGYFGGGWIGAILMTIGIFLPAFLFTLLGHTLMEKVISNPSLHRFLDGVTAGVIGLIAMTAIQLFVTTITSVFSVILFAFAVFILYRFRAKLVPAFVILGAGLISLLYTTVSHAQSNSSTSSLTLIDSIEIPRAAGRIDHMVYDARHQLVFVAAIANNSAEVVDLKNKKVIRTLRNLDEPQGLAYLPQSNSLFVSNGGNGICDVVNANTGQKITFVMLAGDADNVRYDSTENLLYVGYGDGGIAIIDALHYTLLQDIKLTGHPESFQIDKTANKMYVNVPVEKQIEVIDLKSKTVIDKWKMKEATANYPMDLDEAHHRLFIGCRHAPKLLILDAQTGQTISSLDIDADVDDVFYDQARKQIYVSCGGGYVDVFRQSDADHYASLGKVWTASGARTSLFVPELNQLMVAAPSGKNKDAQLLIYEVN